MAVVSSRTIVYHYPQASYLHRPVTVDEEHLWHRFRQLQKTRHVDVDLIKLRQNYTDIEKDGYDVQEENER